MLSSEKGFTPILIIIPVLVIFVVLISVMYLKSQGNPHDVIPNGLQRSPNSQPNFDQIMQQLGCNSQQTCMDLCLKPENANKCQQIFQQFGGSGGFSFQWFQNSSNSSEKNRFPVRNNLPACNGMTLLSRMPADSNTFQYILPLGNVSSSNGGASHVVPSDHIYFSDPHLSNTPIVSEAQAVIQSETIPVYSPGDIQIVEVDAKTYIDSVHNITSNDYSIYFTPCKEVVFYFHHITNINPVISNTLSNYSGRKQCDSHQLDNITLQACNYFELNQKLAAGDKIGLGAFDFGVFDYRQKPAAFVDQAKATTLYAACPLDYFSDPAKSNLYKMVRNTKLNSSGLPDCGTNMQDLPGTIQGNWYLPETNDQSQGGAQNDHEMSIVHLNTNPSIGLIAWGGSITTPNQLHFQPTSSGSINREPSQVAPGQQTYCYQGSLGQSYQPNSASNPNRLDAHILLQLVDNNTIKAQYGQGACPANLNLSNPTTFIR